MDEEGPTTERTPERRKERRVTWNSAFSSERDRPLAGPGSSFFGRRESFFRRKDTTTFEGVTERWLEEQRSKSFLREHLRRKRTERVTGAAAELADVKLESDLPEQAHGCMQRLFPCCKVDASQLPCGRSRSIQVLFGNEAHWAALDSGQRRGGGGGADSGKSVHQGVMFDLPTLEDAGWEKVPDRVNNEGIASPADSPDSKTQEASSDRRESVDSSARKTVEEAGHRRGSGKVMERRSSTESSKARRGSEASSTGKSVERRSSTASEKGRQGSEASSMGMSVERRSSKDSSPSAERIGSKDSSLARRVSRVGSRGRRRSSKGSSPSPTSKNMEAQSGTEPVDYGMTNKQEHEAAFKHLGLTAVTRRQDSRRVFGMLLTVNKEEVPGTAAQVQNLLSTLEKVNHVNAVSLLQVCESEQHLHLVFEDCRGAGLVATRLASHRPLSGHEMATLLHEIAAVLSSCTRFQLSHLDWSLWDVMSKGSDCLFPVKLFGIGLAGVLIPIGRDSHLRTSFYYRPLELSRLMRASANVFGALPVKERRSADVWSLAALAFHAHAGRPPYSGATEAVVRENQLHAKALMVGAALGDLPPEAIALFEQCLQVQPMGRPTAKKVLSHPWIMTSARRGHEGAVNGIIDRLVDFAKQENTMRALGKLFAQAVRPEKEQAMQAMFRAIDVAGDGSLEMNEVIAVAAHRRHEVKALFQALGKDHITAEDFVLANIFSEEILTERLLLETFNTIDLDSNGQISAGELYGAMHSNHPEVTPAEVSRFVHEADVDWSLQLSFEEFCQRIPGASLRKDTNAPRRKALVDSLTLCRTGSTMLQQRLASWLADVRSCHKRLLKIEAENKAFETAGSDRICTRCVKLLGETKKLMAAPPAAKLPPEAEHVLGKKRLLNPPSREHAYGIFALDHFVHHCNKHWSRQFAHLQLLTSEAAQEEHDSIRRVTMDNLIDQSLSLFNDVLAWVESYRQEQVQCLEATMEWEATCPSFPWSRRCIASTEGLSKETALQLEMRLREMTAAAAEEATVARLSSSSKKATLRSVSQKLKLPTIKATLGWAASAKAK